MTLLRLLPENGRVLNGAINLDGRDILTLDERDVRKVRWRGISMVFQAAMNALDPVYRVGDQIIEALQTHFRNLSEDEGRDLVAKLFPRVGLDPGLMDRFPHEFSGGMRQRAVIAMALSCEPKIIIADEPTTALDVIVQDRILSQLRAIQQEQEMGMIYISHDIAVIVEVSDRMGIMYAGRLVELADVLEIFEEPQHPYTVALMSAFPSIEGPRQDLKALPGEPPDLLNPPDGCRFHPRCSQVTSECRESQPKFEEIHPSHYVACWHPLETKRG
jgi:peptide/nickel transport system ATP-binding protein